MALGSDWARAPGSGHLFWLCLTVGGGQGQWKAGLLIQNHLSMAPTPGT